MKKIIKKSSIFSLSPLRIIMLFVGLFTVLFFIKTPQNLNLKKKAASSTIPSNISIVNITDNSFTVIWTTNEPATGAIMYEVKDNAESSVTYDVRDQETKSLKKYTAHYVQISGLKAQTVYTFTIESDGSRVNDGPQPFIVATGRRIEILNPSHPIVLPIPDFSKEEDEVIMVLTARSSNKHSNAIAALVRDKYIMFDGGNFRQNDLTDTFQIKEKIDLVITVIRAQEVWSYTTVISPETNVLASLFLHTIGE